MSNELVAILCGKLSTLLKRHLPTVNDGYWLWIQPVDATQALNLCNGVSYSSVFLGLSLSWRATALSLLWVWIDKSTARKRRIVKSQLATQTGRSGYI